MSKIPMGSFKGPKGDAGGKGDPGPAGPNTVPTDQAIANAVQTEGSATKAALSGTIGTVVTEQVAGAVAGKLDVATAVSDYSPLLGRKLVGFYAALSARASKAVNVLVCGDSISEGFGASNLAARYVARLLADLRAKYPTAGVSGGYGYLPSWYASPNLANLGPTRTGNAVLNGAGQRGLGNRSVTLGADVGAGLGALTFTFTGTSFKLLAAQRVATGTDSVRIVIDGGAFTEWEIVDGTGTSVWTSPALTSGSHTVSVTARFGSSTIEGFMLFDGDETKGIRLWEAAKSGTRADQFSAASGGTSGWASAIPTVDPDLVVIAWMTNDIVSKTSVQYEKSLRDVADLIRTQKASAPLLFMAMYERGTAGLEPWANYVAAMARVASSYSNAAMFDMGTRIPKLAGTGGADLYGLLSDTIHPSDKGHGLLADAIASQLEPVAAVTSSVTPPTPVDPDPANDPRLTVGSLMLVDPTHPGTGNAWADGVPATGTRVPNLASGQALLALGSGVTADVQPMLSYSGLGGSAGILERTSKGGLHAIVSQGSLAAGVGAAMHLPDAIKTFIHDNIGHQFFFSQWGRITRTNGLTTGVRNSYWGSHAASSVTANMHAAHGPANIDAPNSSFPATNRGYRSSTPNVIGAIYSNHAVEGFIGTLPAVASFQEYMFNAGRPAGVALAQATQAHSIVLYDFYIEDLTLSGRTYAAVDALDYQLYTERVLTSGGRYYGDTFTDPATIA